MGRIAIVAYRPMPGKMGELERLVRRHHQRLAACGLVTERAPIMMRARDGTVVEVFEWASAQAIAAAHDHPLVRQMWAEFEGICAYVPLTELEEAQALFAEFEPLGADEALHPEFSP